MSGSMTPVLRDPGVRESLVRQGIAPAGGSPLQLGERVKKEVALWARVVKEAGIKAD